MPRPEAGLRVLVLVEVVALVHYQMSIRNPSEMGIVYILRSTL
jgi:hypothetical protein